MFYDLKLEEQKQQPVLSVRTRTTIEELPNIIGKYYGAIMAYMGELGEQPIIAPYTSYYTLYMQDIVVVMCFPVAARLPGKDEIQAGSLPEGKSVSCMYQGAYSEMEEPYKEIMQWIAEHGYEPTGVYYEYYFNSPAEVAESELLTKIVIPLK